MSLPKRLALASTPYRDPLQDVPWETLEEGIWMPLEALSLYGTFTSLTREQTRLLSRYEFIHFLQAGLWLEGLFMERLGRALASWRGKGPPPAYHLHEIREEAGHSLLFLEVMERSGLPLPLSPYPRILLANAIGRLIPLDHPGFWLAVFIGESITDRINRLVYGCSEVSPAIRSIVHIHMKEEARHIAYAKTRVKQGLERLPRWQRPFLNALLGMAFRQFIGALFFPPRGLYHLAGLDPGEHWEEVARLNRTRWAFIREMATPTLDFLADQGFPIALT